MSASDRNASTSTPTQAELLGPEAGIPIASQIACVERELKMRERVYPRWVQENRMTPAKSEHELRAMRAVLFTLQGLADKPAAGGEAGGAEVWP